MVDERKKIQELDEKLAGASTDLLVIADSADSNNTKKLQISNLPGASTTQTQLSAHELDFNNPHNVTLEQARSEDNQVAGTIDMNSNKILNLATPTTSTDAVNKSYADGLALGLSPQESVLDKDLLTPPGSPSTGDRYIVAGGGETATGDWLSQEKNIAEWGGSAWTFTTPSQGFLLEVSDESSLYYFDGSSWNLFSSLGVNVIDNLNSTSTTEALSANQGNVLDDRVDSLENLSIEWNFATQIISDPADGTFRLNNASRDSATIIYLDKLTGQSRRLDEMVSQFQGFILIQSLDNTSEFIMYETTSTVSDMGGSNGWFEVPVIRRQDSGTEFTSGDACRFTFIPSTQVAVRAMFNAPRITNFSIDIPSRVDLDTSLNVSKTVTYDVIHSANISSIELEVTLGDDIALTNPSSDVTQTESVTLSGITTSAEATVTFKITGEDTQGGTFESNEQTVSVRDLSDDENIYYGLSDSNNPASIDISGLSSSEAVTGSQEITTGTVTSGQYFIILVPTDHDISTIVDDIFNQDVTNIFVRTANVRQINSINFHSYVIGPLNQSNSESYTITLA